MCSLPRSAERRGLRRQAGFTVIELMVGVLIGLLASLAVTHVLVNSEGQKRTTTSASDAQINGALALSALQRAIQPAGYGFAAMPALIGCALDARFAGADVTAMLPDFPTALVPLVITDGGGAAPDTVRVLASGKSSFSLPMRMTAPSYNPASPLTNQKFPVTNTLGVQPPDAAAGVPGDLVVVATDAAAPCEMFQVTAAPTGPEVPRGDHDAGWNPVGFPAGTYGGTAVLVNMGQPVDVTYGIVDDGLRTTTLRIAADGTPSYEGPLELFPQIVNLQAYYGKDTDGNGSVDRWDTTLPAGNAEWQQVIAARVAVVARSTQFEKEDVTFENPQWDVGLAGTFPDAVACGASRCIELAVDGDADWKRYRYRVFDTVIPLRNMIWNS